jgi:hypothetical protein
LKCFYFNFNITPEEERNKKQETRTHKMTTTIARNPQYELPSESGGIPRMEDAEPAENIHQEEESPVSDVCHTPRPGGSSLLQYHEEQQRRINEMNEWRASFTNAANMSAKKAKLRRSANSRTVYLPYSHPNLKMCMDILKFRVTGVSTEAIVAADSVAQKKLGLRVPELIDEHEFNILKHALIHQKIRIDVSDTATITKKEMCAMILTEEMKMQEADKLIQIFEKKTKESPAETGTTEEPAEPAAVYDVSDAEYQEAKKIYSDSEYWHAALTKEKTRCWGPEKNRLWLPVPVVEEKEEPKKTISQQVRISNSSKHVFTKIISPETLRRPFIEMDTLAKTFTSDMIDFLLSPKRVLDRKHVADQIVEFVAVRRRLLRKEK